MVPITKMIKSGIIIDIIGVFAITVPIVIWLVKTVMEVLSRRAGRKQLAKGNNIY